MPKSTNSPNRRRKSSPPSPARNPTPEEITQLRESFGLTENEAAGLLHTTYRAYHQWEMGERRMHPAFLALLRIEGAKEAARRAANLSG